MELELEMELEMELELDEEIAAMDANRKSAARNRHASLMRDKAKRMEKARRKAKLEAIEECDNGHFFVGLTNERGFCNVSLIEKKSNRQAKQALRKEMLAYA